MTSPPPQSGEPPSDEPTIAREVRGPSLGTILFGSFLILFGVLWLLDRTETVDLSWTVLLPGILVLVGLALIIQARTGSHDGLITIGVILTVVLTLTNLANVDLDASIGTHENRPTTFEQLESEYALGIGQQTLDLTEIDFPAGETTVKASVGIGQLVVELPEDVGARIEWSVGIGAAEVLADEETGGLGQDGDETTPNFETAEQRVILELSVGIGKIEVTQ